MYSPIVHLMSADYIADRQTTRYTCPICDRCLEDGPEGIVLLHKGDPSVSHRGGVLQQVEGEVHAAAAAPPSPLH